MGSLSLPKWKTVIRWSELPGQGTPIVCLPGLSIAAVPNFLDLMTRKPFIGRRIIMLDYVGSGLSGHSETFGYSLDEHTEAIVAALDEMQLGPACLFGYSMGGTIAISVSLSRPDLVSRLIVAEANLTPGGGDATRMIAAQDRDAFIEEGYGNRMNGLADAALEGSAFADFLCAARTGADPRGVHSNAVALVNLPADFQDCFLGLSVERHVIWGEKTFPKSRDDITPDAPDPELMRKNSIGVHVVPGVGHMLMIDDPSATANVLAPFA